MNSINSYLNNNLNEVRSVIENEMDIEFNSHQFIERFAYNNEAIYISWLNKSIGKGAFQTVHSQIAKFLSQNKEVLRISKNGRDGSINVFGNTTSVQFWKKES